MLSTWLSYRIKLAEKCGKHASSERDWTKFILNAHLENNDAIRTSCREKNIYYKKIIYKVIQSIHLWCSSKIFSTWQSDGIQFLLKHVKNATKTITSYHFLFATKFKCFQACVGQVLPLISVLGLDELAPYIINQDQFMMSVFWGSWIHTQDIAICHSYRCKFLVVLVTRRISQ